MREEGSSELVKVQSAVSIPIVPLNQECSLVKRNVNAEIAVAALNFLRSDATEAADIEQVVGVLQIEVFAGGEGDLGALKISLQLALLLEGDDLLLLVPRSQNWLSGHGLDETSEHRSRNHLLVWRVCSDSDFSGRRRSVEGEPVGAPGTHGRATSRPICNVIE